MLILNCVAAVLTAVRRRRKSCARLATLLFASGLTVGSRIVATLCGRGFNRGPPQAENSHAERRRVGPSRTCGAFVRLRRTANKFAATQD